MTQKKTQRGIYLVIILALAILSVNLSSAALLFGTQTTQPSPFQYYSGKIQDYWPGFSSEQCVDRQDFSVQIAPLGCTPSVVRSDLLEEQNVPVFCQLQGLKTNPMIDIPEINNIAITGNVPKEIAGIGFHPARAALQTGATLEGTPLMDNLGYVVVMLKRQPSENATPDWIQAELKAQISYNLEKVYGTGTSSFVLTPLSSTDWSSRYTEYSFFKGKGYIKLDDITKIGDAETARVSIYRDKDNKLATLTLSPGQTSSDLFLEGFYCTAGFNVRLDKLDYATTKAKLIVDGNPVWIVKGSSILDDKCRVDELESTYYGSGRITIGCAEQQYELEINPPKADIQVYPDCDAKNKLYEGEFSSGTEGILNVSGQLTKYYTYLVYVGKNKQSGQEYAITLTTSNTALFSETFLSVLNTKINQIVFSGISSEQFDAKETEIKNMITGLTNEKDIIIRIMDKTRGVCIGDKGIKNYEEKKAYGFNLGLTFTGIVGPKERIYNKDKESEIGSMIENYYNKAQEAYRKVIASYPNEQSSSLEEYGAIALRNAAELAGSMEKLETKEKLLNELKQKFPKAFTQEDQKILDNMREKDMSKASTIITTKSQTFSVILSEIQEPTIDDLGVELIVNGQAKKLTVNDDVDDEGKIKITKIENDVVYFDYSQVNPEGKIFNLYTNSFTLKEKESRAVITDAGSTSKDSPRPEKKATIIVSKINTRKIAYTSIFPKQNNGMVETNFTFKIAVEKRAIKLSPEKTKEMIGTLNSTIAKWEKVTNQLGNTVSTLKTACFATSFVLWAKNLFTNMNGGSGERRAVMEKWKVFCKDEVANKDYYSASDCYYKNKDAIDKDISAMKSTLASATSCIDSIKSEQQKILAAQKDKTPDQAYAQAASAASCFKYDIALQKENQQAINTKPVLDKFTDMADKGYIFTSDIDSVINNLEIKKACDSGKLSETYCKEQNTAVYDEFSSLDKLKINAAQQPSTDTFKQNVPALTPPPYLPDAAAVGYNLPVYTAIPPITSKGKEIVPATQSAPVLYTYAILPDIGASFIILSQVGAQDQYSMSRVFKISDNAIGEEVTVAQPSILNQKLGQVVKGVPVSKCSNKFKESDLIVKYFETSPYKGLPALVPVTQDGWYVKITDPKNAYTQSGQLTNFYMCNVAENGRIDETGGDDSNCCQQIFNGKIIQGTNLPGLDTKKSEEVIQKAVQCVNQAGSQYGKTKVMTSSCAKSEMKAAVQPLIPEQECEDFMSPEDCHLLFNVCDPVICPPSRCNMGGRYYVEDVIQTGVVGGIMLCLPNKAEGIAVPICLSGVQAGLDNYLTILKSARDCLQESLETGQNVGICDEIKSIYLCDFFWRQASPFFQIIMPKMLYSVAKIGGGGGEYMDVFNAWQTTMQSVSYFKDYYAVNAFKAFQTRTVAEAGTDVCRAFISKKFDIGNMFDALSEPESPVQFSAWFDEIPQTTATIPATSQYKVYYHIYAGKDQGVYYSVYLKTKIELSLYAKIPTRQVASGYIGKGSYADETKDFTAPAGYEELCVMINAQEKCGFKKVSTDFAVNYLTEQYIADQAKQTVTSEKECVSGTPSATALIPAINPNLQSGAQESLQPELYKRGIVRICSSENPSSNTEPERWSEVGFCDTGKKIKCWLDTNSVKEAIQDLKLEQEVLDTASSKLSELETGLIQSISDTDKTLQELEGKKNTLLQELKKLIQNYKNTKISTEVKESFTLAQGDFTFAFDSAVLTSEAKAKIDSEFGTKVQSLKKGSVIEIDGWASAEGLEEHNKELSTKRAQAVYQYIVNNKAYYSAIQTRQIQEIKVEGKGETKYFSIQKCIEDMKKAGKYTTKIQEECTQKVYDELAKVVSIGKTKGDAAARDYAANSVILAEDRRVIVKFSTITETTAEKEKISFQELQGEINAKINPLLAEYNDVIKNAYLNKHKAKAWLAIGDIYSTIAVELKQFAPPEIQEKPVIILPPKITEIIPVPAAGKETTSGTQQGTTLALKGKKITIDPGHGGKDSGTSSSDGLMEKTVNLDVAQKLKADLEKQGATVVMTRSTDLTSDTTLESASRVEKSSGDIFISIHTDSPNGKEAVYYYEYTAARSTESKKLATSIHTLLYKISGKSGSAVLPDTATNKKSIYVLRNTKMPAVLVEIASIDDTRLKQTIFKQSIADAISQGIASYLT